jgi:hypothetical protein
MLRAALVISAGLVLWGSEVQARPPVHVVCTDGDPIARIRVGGRTSRAPFCDATADGTCAVRLRVFCQGLVGECPSLDVSVPLRHRRHLRFLGRRHVVRCTAAARRG